MMKTLTLTAAVPYDIVIGEGILADSGAAVKELFPKGKTVIVTDENVEPLYLDALKQSFEAAGITCAAFISTPGETSKSLSILEKLLTYFSRAGLGRNDFVTALGGGVIGDLAGFAAAVYLRGIPYIQIPTTLLAAVDASVGGKTAVNLREGKNLVGAFHQPSLVWCDYATHTTMAAERYADGIAEAIKCAVLRGGDFFTLLETENLYRHIPEVIESCVALKARIVEEDEKDRGWRQFLNLGHTLGHAIEARSDYRITHGQAVACGIVTIAELGALNGLVDYDCRDRLAAIMSRYGLMTELPYPLKELLPYVLRDKKRSDEGLCLVIPENIGRCRLVTVEPENIETFFRI